MIKDPVQKESQTYLKRKIGPRFRNRDWGSSLRGSKDKIMARHLFQTELIQATLKSFLITSLIFCLHWMIHIDATFSSLITFSILMLHFRPVTVFHFLTWCIAFSTLMWHFLPWWRFLPWCNTFFFGGIFHLWVQHFSILVTFSTLFVVAFSALTTFLSL